MRAFAWALGVVAALCVVGTAVAALVAGPDPDAPLTLSSGAARVEVPAAHWSRSAQGTAIAYRDRGGRTLVLVAAPALYRKGECAADPQSTRAYAGFVDRTGRSVDEIARHWGRAITLDATTGRPVGAVHVTVATSGRADADLAVPAGPCNPPRQHLTVVATGGRALVLVRDLGVPGALPEQEAESLLASLTP